MSFKRFLLTGSLGFCLASLAVFATVAFAEGWLYNQLGVYGAYLVWTSLFIVLGGTALRPLVLNQAQKNRFNLIFAAGFLLDDGVME